VLVVEDDPALLGIYVACLETEFDVLAALSADEAEHLLRTRRVKAIVSDNLMPGRTGLHLLAHLRATHPEVPRVLVTGFLRPEAILRAVNDAELFRLLIKPLRMPDLLQVVRDAVRAHDAATLGTAH
jgi:DNA-binding NtrC family response regulator